MPSAFLTLIRGLPGSGKSSLASHFTQNDKWCNTIHLEADMFHMQKGEYVFDKEKVHAGHKWCQETTRIFLNNGKSVIVSNTFTTLKEIQPYLDIAQELGVKYLIYHRTNSFGSIHNVPPETIQHMQNRWQPIEGEHAYSGELWSRIKFGLDGQVIN